MTHAPLTPGGIGKDGMDKVLDWDGIRDDGMDKVLHWDGIRDDGLDKVLRWDGIRDDGMDKVLHWDGIRNDGMDKALWHLQRQVQRRGDFFMCTEENARLSPGGRYFEFQTYHVLLDF